LGYNKDVGKNGTGRFVVMDIEDCEPDRAEEKQ
jgi:hypothetical protein